MQQVSETHFSNVVALPEREIVTVPLKLSEILTDLFRRPMSVAVNVTSTVHLVPGASGDKDRQLSFSEKSPVVFSSSIFIGAAVLLVKEICWKLLLIPTAWLAKFSQLADGSSAWGGTVMGIAI